MTFGKKIALGFAALILLAAGIGGLAHFTMTTARNQAVKLASEFVPETEVAAQLGQEVAETQLSIRSYGFTAENNYLEEGRKHLQLVYKQMEAARKLASEHRDLVQLAAELAKIEPSVKNWDKLIAETEEKCKEIVADREKLNKAAADFIANIDKLIAGQSRKMEQEIKAFTETGKLQERLKKLMLATEIRGEGNAARIAVFKSQALRDPAVIAEGIKTFDAMDKRFEELLGMLHVQADIAELNAVKEDAHLYRDTMKQVMAASILLAEIAKKRSEAAESVALNADELQHTGMKRTTEAANSSAEKLSSAASITAFSVIGGTLLGLLIALFIIRSTTRVLTRVADVVAGGAEQTAAAAGQVSASSQSLAEGASEQAASLEETSASLEEMTSMIKRNSDNAQAAKAAAVQTRSSAETGAEQVKILLEAMDSIKTASEDITKILKSIDEIAFQTNILALNAAVEAAGAGFAVVADEVRNLAQRCAAAARETAVKIEDSVKRSQQGSNISAEVAKSFSDIKTRVHQLDELVAGIASASLEQSQGISQVNTAVTQMDKVTQSTAASAEECASASEELNAQAETVKAAVEDLQRLVKGAAVSQPAPGSSLSGKRASLKKGAVSAPSAKHGSAKRPRDNGHAVLAGVNGSHKSEELPMDGDFENF